MLIEEYRVKLRKARPRGSRFLDRIPEELGLRIALTQAMSQCKQSGLSRGEAISHLAAKMNMGEKNVQRYIYPADDQAWLTRLLRRHPLL